MDGALGSYRRMDGIEATLRRVSIRLSARIGREFGLEKAVSELLDNFDELGSDFGEFFPLLQAHVGKG
jgi:acyl carrier protein phosphodiesterase